MKKYIARKATNIQDDIKRGWSSWNFGEEGIKCDGQQLEIWKVEAVQNDTAFFISGFELWGDDILTADIRELYKNYWVLVDNENGHGLAGVLLNSTNLDDAIKGIDTTDFSGDGYFFDADNANLLYSNNDIHIFEIN